jgi:peptide/nickel transport system permease protein
MLADAQRYMLRLPMLSVYPGLALSVLVLGLNLLGDGLRDYLDPRTRRREAAE